MVRSRYVEDDELVGGTDHVFKNLDAPNFFDDVMTNTRLIETVEETGDEFFLKAWPKTFNMAPSESDYENQSHNSEEGGFW